MSETLLEKKKSISTFVTEIHKLHTANRLQCLFTTDKPFHVLIYDTFILKIIIYSRLSINFELNALRAIYFFSAMI